MAIQKIGSISSWDQIKIGSMNIDKGKRQDTFKYNVELNGKKLTVWVSYKAADSHNLEDVQKKLFDTMQKIRKLQPAYKFGEKVSSITFRSSQKEGPKVELTYAKGYKSEKAPKGAKKTTRQRWVKPIQINSDKINSYQERINGINNDIENKKAKMKEKNKKPAEIRVGLQKLNDKLLAAKAKHQVYSTMLKVSKKTAKSTRIENARVETNYTVLPIPSSIDSGAKVADWDALELNEENPLIKMEGNRSGTIHKDLFPKAAEQLFDELIEEFEQEQG